MPEAPNQPASLSEISHLFLSSLRERQTGGGRPTRTPPRAADPDKEPGIDLTAEEFSQVLKPAEPEEPWAGPPARVLLASHLGGQQAEAVEKYAGAIAANGQRVGLIRIDAAEFHLTTFEPATAESAVAKAVPAVQISHTFDARAIRDGIQELSCDLDLWLVAPANIRQHEARGLLRKAGHWVLLSGCEHEAIVSAYRALKGVEEIAHPRLSIAASGNGSASEAEAMYRRLASVAGQFLQWPAEAEVHASPNARYEKCDVMHIVAGQDKAKHASVAHWQIVEELLDLARLARPKSQVEAVQTLPNESDHRDSGDDIETGDFSARRTKPRNETTMNPFDSQSLEAGMRVPPSPPAAWPSRPSPSPSGPRLVSDAPRAAESSPFRAISQIIDLPDNIVGNDGILAAVLGASAGEIVECPMRPPMCPAARLAVTRDRRLILLAVADRDLASLATIAQALRWMTQNRQLLAMAMPQFSLDGGIGASLRLLVDDPIEAEILRPLFALATVQVQSYRRVRWAEKMGLLLEAA